MIQFITQLNGMGDREIAYFALNSIENLRGDITYYPNISFVVLVRASQYLNENLWCTIFSHDSSQLLPNKRVKGSYKVNKADMKRLKKSIVLKTCFAEEVDKTCCTAVG